MNILMKMFYGGMFVGGMIGIAIMCIIAIIAIEISERKENKND